MAKEDLISYAVTVVRIMTRSLFDSHLSGLAFPTPGGGVLLGILGGGVPPGFLNPDPYFRPKNVIFDNKVLN